MLVVSETQDQANKHVQAIASYLERIGIGRDVNTYGNSKGWRLDLLRADNGFNVLAFGLDAGARGVKLDEFRPDIIVPDDIDGLHDTLVTTAKKIETLTRTVFPAGSPDCAYLFVQNRILEFGVMSQLADGTAEFLLDREPISEEPAILGLRVELELQEDGQRLYRIVEGEPTWAGQNLEVCERDINDFGLAAFKTEKQHEVQGAQGVFFKTGELRTIAPEDVPPLISVCLAGDLAATEGGGNHTALALMGLAANKTYYLLAMIRGQWGSEKVRAVIDIACAYYRPMFPKWKLHLPQDPGQAGKDQKTQMGRRYASQSAVIESVSGKKAARATGLAEEVNKGNVYLVEQDLPECFAPYMEDLTWIRWHMGLREEMRKFREDEQHDADDQVDAESDAFNELTTKKQGRAY